MQTLNLQLFKALDAEEAYAIRLPHEEKWLAQSGFGSQLEFAWNLEIQSEGACDRKRVDWEAVLERAIEAYRLSDPVLTNFRWPEYSSAQSGGKVPE